MKFKSILVLFLILLISFANNNRIVGKDNVSSVSESLVLLQKRNNVISYTVKKGETLYSIAATHNTTVDEIYKLNPESKKGINAGEQLLIKQVKTPSRYSSHKIEAKETMYSVSKMYNISVEDLKEANPSLGEDTFNIGRTIRIPVFGNTTQVTNETVERTTGTNKETKYKVKKGETLYSIGRAYNVSVEDLLDANPDLKNGGLREGISVNIPTKQERSKQIVSTANTSATKIETPYASKGETVRVGVLLPFLDDKGSVQKEKLTEYYEGFLLAVKELKSKGLNAEIYTFDIGTERDTKKLESLLGTNEMKNLHLIIGGVSKQQIDVLTRFSKKTGIKYAIPFGSSKEIASTPTLFQMTTPHSSLYPEIISTFRKEFSNYNVIFISEAGSNNDKSDFTEELKKELTRASIQFKTIGSSGNLLTDISSALSTSKKNILIPTSSSEATLKRILNATSSISENSFTLFGYPEWQTYTQQTSGLQKHEAHIYSIFFLDEQQSAVQNFANEYKRWYNKDLINSYPKYGYLGYDTGLYFLTALRKNGSHFDQNISDIHVPTLQSAIYFKQQVSNEGFVNRGIYFIRYKPESGIEKTDISK